jgi:hypothetical protein
MLAIRQDDTASEHDVAGPTTEWEDLDRVGTFRYDSRSGQVRWSRTAADMYGCEAEIATVDVLLKHEGDCAEVADSLRRIAEGRAFRSQHRLLDRAGNVRWIVTVGQAVRSAAGEIVGTRGLVLDATDTVQCGVAAAASDVAEFRGPIEQVKGVLMASHGVTGDQAFDTLVRHSQNANVKVRDIADRFLEAVSGGLSGGDMRAQVDNVLHRVGADGGAPGRRRSRRRVKDRAV